MKKLFIISVVSGVFLATLISILVAYLAIKHDPQQEFSSDWMHYAVLIFLAFIESFAIFFSMVFFVGVFVSFLKKHYIRIKN
ncbi:MAG: hypothetical protein WBK77_05180 [Alphaproteobacteria bacterium]